MAYYIGTIVSTPPPGSIMAYLGSSDPNGWVICDGTTRTNNSDGRYNNLNTLSIGSGGSGTTSYTPPNFKGAFLRGIGTSAINSGYSGPGSLATNPSSGNGQYQDMGILAHGHTVTDPGHTHDFKSYNDDYNGSAGGTEPYGFIRDSVTVLKSLTQALFPGWGVQTNTTGITIGTSSVNTGNGAYVNTETRPYNMGVNWIIKL